MTKDIYNTKQFKKNKRHYYPVDETVKNDTLLELASVKKQLSEVSEQLEKVQEVTKRITPNVTVEMPEVQKVQVLNPTPKTELPEVQKVEIINPTEQKDVEFPEVQKVEVLNHQEVKFPNVQKVEVTNPTKLELPTGEKDIPGKADPTKYFNVRLTDGEKYYKAQTDAYVAAAKTVFPFVDPDGKPKPVKLDEYGNLPTSSSATITTTSGAPLFTYNVNEPTVRQVYVTNQTSTSVTTTSGTPLDVTVRNIPTVQAVQGNVSVVSLPSLTTASGSQVDVKNFPTVQTIQGNVSVTSLPSVTTTSGSVVDIKNFPTIQTVVVKNQQDLTISGSQHAFIDNFPTVQKVYVENQTSTSVTTTSGTPLDVNIRNLPTVQTVNVQNIPSVSISSLPNVTTVSGSTVDVKNFPTIQTVQGNVSISSLPSVTTASGSMTDIKNFPTVQTVVVKNLQDVTVSGSQHTLIDNFPTIQRVYVDNPTTASVTTTSGSPLHVFSVNEPTVRQVFVTNPSSATVTTTSGTPLDVTVRNLPTIQTVNVQNLPENFVTEHLYADGSVATAISGTVMLWKDSGNTLRSVSTTKPLPVILQVNDGVDVGDVTITNPSLVVTQGSPGNLAAVVYGYVQNDAALTGVGPLTAGAYASAAAPTAVSADGDNVFLWADRNGRLQVGDGGQTLSIDDGSGAITVDNAGTFAVQVDGSALTSLQLIDDPVATTASAIPSKGMAISGTDGTNARIIKTDTSGELQVDVLTMPTVTVNSHAVTNAGTFAVQVDGSALTALQLIDDSIFSDDAAFTPGTSKVNVIGFQADETSTDSVDEGDAGAARMTLDRKQITTPQPHTTGGLSIFRSLDIDETEEDVKTSAGQVYGLIFTNTATTTRWLKFYNATAANVTVGSTTPVITIGLPGNTSDDISGLFNSGGMGITFDTAISVACTTGLADNDTGAPSANDVVINVFYK